MNAERANCSDGVCQRETLDGGKVFDRAWCTSAAYRQGDSGSGGIYVGDELCLVGGCVWYVFGIGVNVEVTRF